MSRNPYEWADGKLNSSPGYDVGFTQLLAVAPYKLPHSEYQVYSRRLIHIREFQQAALKLFQAALADQTDRRILHWMLNETPESLGIAYHRSLHSEHFTQPVFYRTDEVRPGRIAEIQCPGSLWGEVQLLYDLEYTVNRSNNLGQAPADLFCTNLESYLSGQPVVHHLLDNASVPAGMRYFIQRTRPRVQYYSIDHDVRPSDCNFVRSHSFFGLAAENYFKERMRRVGRGVHYDLPPHVLFDQKATVALPFWSLTRDHFSDCIRNMFLFTTPLTPEGIELPDRNRATIEEFSGMTRSQRSFYLKYAGSDVAINWGSKGVYRLSNMSSNACLSLLKKCLRHFRNGHIWVLQKEEKHDDEIEFLTRELEHRRETRRAKFSGFYGPNGCIGVMVMHGRRYKVHGQTDTVISLVLPGEDANAGSSENRDQPI